MRTILLISALAVASLSGCSKSSTDSKTSTKPAVAEAPAPKVDAVTIDQLDTQLASNDCVAVDANGTGTRKKMGVIPGAVLLTDSESYDLKELPTDKAKPLVFYCASTSCGASHEAAGKAILAGYRNVKVLPDGISGWVKAGKKVQSI